MALIATLVFSGCLFLSSITTNSLIFTFLFGTGLGFMGGLAWVPPLTLSIKYFPDKKAIVTGIIISSTLISALPYSFLCLLIVNPENKTADIHVKDGEAQDKYYSQDVYKNVLHYSYFIGTNNAKSIRKYCFNNWTDFNVPSNRTKKGE